MQKALEVRQGSYKGLGLRISDSGLSVILATESSRTHNLRFDADLIPGLGIGSFSSSPEDPHQFNLRTQDLTLGQPSAG